MKFQFFDCRQGNSIFAFNFRFGAFSFLEKFKKDLGIFYKGFDFQVILNPFLVTFQGFKQAFGLLGVIPEIRIQRELLFFFYLD